MDSFLEAQHLRIKGNLEQLNGEFLSLLNDNCHHIEAIQRLESELNVYKRAFADVDSEIKRYKAEKIETDKQREDLEARLKGHRVVALIDGDGAIFSKELIAQGQAGGLQAAQQLSDSILQHLSEQYGSHQYQLWVYVFLNKKGLMEALGRLGSPALKQSFEDFVTGFNQAAERFLMLDVGNAKEAADSKLKCRLEDDIRLPQTFKIIFAGTHDNGYVTHLRSQITAGYKNKLILMKSYTEMAAGIRELDLPVLAIPNLFIPEKLGFNGAEAVAPRLPSYTSATRLPPVGGSGERKQSVSSQTSSTSSPPTTYSAAAALTSNLTSKRAPTPELDSSDGSATDESDYGDGLPHEAVVTAMASPSPYESSRYINPNIALSKHKPPPCTLFYLASCKHGSSCKYGHDYYLEAEHYDTIRANAKKAPCPALNRGEACTWGEDCCYGHYCSALSKCHYLKLGKCKFVGVNMHKDPKI